MSNFAASETPEHIIQHEKAEGLQVVVAMGVDIPPVPMDVVQILIASGPIDVVILLEEPITVLFPVRN